MTFALRSHNLEGITRPRLVAHSLQLAKLLEEQKRQMGMTVMTQEPKAIHYADEAYLAGAILYFMIERIDHCNKTDACDPSKASIFHWFDDTTRRVLGMNNTDQKNMATLQKERGNFVAFLLAEHPSFAQVTNVLQTLSPYAFQVASVPEQGHLVTRNFELTTKDTYYSMLQHLLSQYLTAGADLLHQYAEYHQLFEMRLLLRNMVTMRTLVRGVGKAAMVNSDYLTAVKSFAFSGDLQHAEVKSEFLHYIESAQNNQPETCEKILESITLADQDWFNSLRQIYQAASSQNVGVSS